MLALSSMLHSSCRVQFQLLTAMSAATLAVVLTMGDGAWAEIYQYVDANGTISITNVPNDPRYRPISKELPRQRSTVSEQDLRSFIDRHSRMHQLHPALIRAVIKAESDFDPMAVSRAGAVGLMQLMPETADRLEVRNPYDPHQNIAGGTRYLRQLLDRFQGNLPLALAAYNAGATTVERYQSLPPFPETRRYVRKVLQFYREFLIRDQVSRLGLSRPHATRVRPLSLLSSSPAR